MNYRQFSGVGLTYRRPFLSFQGFSKGPRYYGLNLSLISNRLISFIGATLLEFYLSSLKFQGSPTSMGITLLTALCSFLYCNDLSYDLHFLAYFLPLYPSNSSILVVCLNNDTLLYRIHPFCHQIIAGFKTIQSGETFFTCFLHCCASTRTAYF